VQERGGGVVVEGAEEEGALTVREGEKSPEKVELEGVVMILGGEGLGLGGG